MLSLVATFVFVLAGCTSALVIARGLHRAAPVIRQLHAERDVLAQDRVYLFTLIETPRANAAALPQPLAIGAVGTTPLAVAQVVKRRTAAAIPASLARFQAAA